MKLLLLMCPSATWGQGPALLRPDSSPGAHPGRPQGPRVDGRSVLCLLRARVLACSCAQPCPTLCNPMERSLPVSSVWDFPGGNTGVGCHALLQGLFRPRDPTQVSCVSSTGRRVLYH